MNRIIKLFPVLFVIISAHTSLAQNSSSVKADFQNKIRELGRYMSKVAEKNNRSIRKQVQDLALDLFLSPNEIIQVSRYAEQEEENSKIKELTISEYLDNLGSLKYDSVYFEWVHIGDPTCFSTGSIQTDKLSLNNRCEVILEQVFRGFKNDAVAYEDRTFKKVEGFVIEIENSNRAYIQLSRIEILETVRY